MIDVQHSALRAFEQDRFAFIECVVHQFRGIADIPANFGAEAQRFFHFVREIDVRPIGAFGQAVFLRHNARSFLAKQLGFQ